MGCIFAIFNFVAFLIFASVLGLILNAFGVIQISIPQFQWFLPFAVLFFVFVVAVVFLAVRNLRRVSRPLDELVDASAKVAEGDFSVRVDEQGPLKSARCCMDFNSMAEHLQENDQQRRNMLADVSHELRTPLTVIQGNVEGILDGMYAADEARMKSVLEETQVIVALDRRPADHVTCGEWFVAIAA